MVAGGSGPLAVALVELDTTAAGLAAADTVLKAADCTLFKGTTVCPGKFLLIFGGAIASIREAYVQVESEYAGHLLDGYLLGAAAQGLLSALAGGNGAAPEPGNALGVLETFSASAAIAGADACLKAAAVDLLDIRLAQGMAGKGIVYLQGHVASVEAALTAAKETIRQNGGMCLTGCLASPHKDVWAGLSA
jgi:microcompartment protein CcmL/EutN